MILTTTPDLQTAPNDSDKGGESDPESDEALPRKVVRARPQPCPVSFGNYHQHPS
jgi:hypothetical protein